MTVSVAMAAARDLVATNLQATPMWAALHTDQPMSSDPTGTLVNMSGTEFLPVTWTQDGAVLVNIDPLVWVGITRMTTARYVALSADSGGGVLLFYASLDEVGSSVQRSFQSLTIGIGGLRIIIA